MAELKKVTDISPYMGCDPEFFFKQNGEVVGAEKFIPKNGLTFDFRATSSIKTKEGKLVRHGDFTSLGDAPASKFIIDGVQAELNPRPNTCRANLANEIKCCFIKLKEELAKENKGFTVDFSRAVEIPRANLMELEEKSRTFGCAPSNSIYKTSSKIKGIKLENIDATEYRVRAAGGHIHIGKKGYTNLTAALTTHHEQTVKMLDILCGNTCVLLDRDEANIERRKVYGKAGEYRLPEHGLEYRTLSNFWLTSYPLMSLAFGMARLAVQLIADAKREEYFEAFTSAVKPKKIHDAITNNDFDLAMENFKAVEPLILQVSQAGTCRYAISATNIKEWYYFVDSVKNKGLTYWWPNDPMTNWIDTGELHTGGFYDFLNGPVREEMKVELDKLKTA